MKDKIENLLKNGTAEDVEIAIYLAIVRLTTEEACNLVLKIQTKNIHLLTFRLGRDRYRSYGYSTRGGHFFLKTALSCKELKTLGYKNISK